jgi:hypothetical protein
MSQAASSPASRPTPPAAPAPSRSVAALTALSELWVLFDMPTRHAAEPGAPKQPASIRTTAESA